MVARSKSQAAVDSVQTFDRRKPPLSPPFFFLNLWLSSASLFAAFDATHGIFWAQCVYNNGRTYRLIGLDARSGRVAHNLTDPYMAGGMACGGGRCFLIGITHTLVRAGTFERVLVELSCPGTAAGECTVSTPLLRLPGVCIMLGGLMTIDPKTKTLYAVLQNNSATSPCGGGTGVVNAGDLVRWAPMSHPTSDADVARAPTDTQGTPATATATDTGFKLLGIGFSSEVPVVVGEPVLCASVMLCPISITAA